MDRFGEDALSHALAAVAHPVRRDLLARVRERPVRVTELAAGFAISLPAVSRHLKVLENAGLVTRSIAGRDHFIAASEPGWRGVALWPDGIGPALAVDPARPTPLVAQQG